MGNKSRKNTAAAFSRSWKGSSQPRKQRSFRRRAPLHLRQRFLHVHLSKELRAKYGRRQLQVRTGDKVRVMRGQFAPREGAVDSVHLRRERVYVSGVESLKKDGSKVPYPLHPSNLLLVSAAMSDVRRRKRTGAQEGSGKAAKKK